MGSRQLSLVIFLLLSVIMVASQQMTTDTNNRPHSYNEVITDKAVTRNGFFKVHQVQNKYYFEIPDSIFGRDILIVNRVSKTQMGMGYAGDEIGQNVVRFEKGLGFKVFIRTVSYAVYAKDSSSPMFAAVNNSNIQPITTSFDIKAYGKDLTTTVIDVTDFINGDNDILFYPKETRVISRIGPLLADKSYIENIAAFSTNVEITTLKTYERAPRSVIIGQQDLLRNITVELHSSLVLLPKVLMQPRYFDERVGYFSTGYIDYDVNPQGVKNIEVIKKWRLEPKDQDIEKYNRGELVEPKKPIVFYIDPATPKKWIPYLIQGINDWQKAFEKAGFKNAIIGKVAPSKEQDSMWNIDDAHYSAIVYKASERRDASGPSISDPRTGEIIESHIDWYHNVMQWLRDCYMIQAGPNDPRARQMIFPDDLMGQLIRVTVSHEVGHTLGLCHNLGASSSIPVDSLRNKKWVESFGHTPSIMDYARFNYVAQRGDNIASLGLFPRIGEYDLWAIEWGYRLIPQYKSAQAERSYLNQWVIKKLKDHRLWWGDGENGRGFDDPRTQSEDLGNDAIKASLYGIKNLKWIVPQLMLWTKEDNEDYSNLSHIYDQLALQFSNYMRHVSRNLGGIYKTPRMVEEKEPVYEIVPKTKQAQSIAFLNQQLFTTPKWLINDQIYSRTGANGLTVVGNIQDAILNNNLLNGSKLNNLINSEAAIGSKAYKITDLFNDLKKGIWAELSSGKAIDVYRRNLQKSYINILDNLLNSQLTKDKSDIRSVVTAHLVKLKIEVKAASQRTTDVMTRWHLQDIEKRINRALNPKQ